MNRDAAIGMVELKVALQELKDFTERIQPMIGPLGLEVVVRRTSAEKAATPSKRRGRPPKVAVDA